MKILVAIDNSKFSAAALRMLLMQNQTDRAGLRVLHVVEPMDTPFYPELTPPYPASLEDVRVARLKAGRELVARTVAQLREGGFKVDGAVRLGMPGPTGVDAANKWHADLIVVGSHGHKGLTRLLLGSVSDHVARHAPCSVEIVRTRRRTKG
jgi:nucleotide-binding universal stress UspA family protein